MNFGKLATAGCLGLALWSAALDARAFCITHGCDPQKEDCFPDAHGCITNGPELHWGSRCVSFDLQRDGSLKRRIDYDQAHDAVLKAFAQWLEVDCGQGRGPSIRVSDYGPVDCHTPEYNQEAPNANIVMFRDQDWPYENAIDTLALTTLIFDANTGEIFDADVEINTYASDMTTGHVGPLDVDLHSVLTHEVGHFLGLSHTNVPHATMDASYTPGDTEMATVEADDVDGICAALPPGRKTAKTSCEPRHGFSGECALQPNSCAFAPSRDGELASALALLLGLSSRPLRRKLRRGARRP